MQTVENVISTAATNERFAAVVEPVLSGISDGIDSINSVLPGNAHSTLEVIRKKINNKGTGGSGDSIPTTSSTRPDLPNNISRAQLGELIGSGGNKDVFAFGDNQAVGILKPGKNPTLLDKELELLSRLDSFGLPVVNAQGPILVDGNPALLFDRFAIGSKDIVRLDGNKIRIVGNSQLLNQKSIDDLTAIRETMITNKVRVHDLQFLIGDNGRVVISDPIDVLDLAPSTNNLRTINLLIESARRNLN